MSRYFHETVSELVRMAQKDELEIYVDFGKIVIWKYMPAMFCENTLNPKFNL